MKLKELLNVIPWTTPIDVDIYYPHEFGYTIKRNYFTIAADFKLHEDYPKFKNAKVTSLDYTITQDIMAIKIVGRI